MTLSLLCVGVYLAGVAVAVVRCDAPPVSRLGLALLWPVGPLAFVVTVSILLAAAAIAFPLFGGVLAAAFAIGWWSLH